MEDADSKNKKGENDTRAKGAPSDPYTPIKSNWDVITKPRIRIINALFNHEGLIISQIEREARLPHAVAFENLKVLMELGLVTKKQISEKSNLYSINRKNKMVIALEKIKQELDK